MASGPIFGNPANNLFNAATLLSSSSNDSIPDLQYPLLNAVTRLIGNSFRSSHYTFVIGAGNNKLDFDIGGSLLTATIANGTYYGEELATQVATAMNTAASTTDIKCFYNRLTHEFTITKGSGTLRLRWLTNGAGAAATNKNNSIGVTLQFVTWADQTGSLSYTGEASAFGTGGFYRITSSNQNLYYNDGVTNRTAAIPIAVYNAKDLAAEIKYQMDNTSSVTTTNGFFANHYSFQAGSKPHYWLIGRNGGTITLRCTQTTDAIWGCLGYDTAADKSGSTTYISDYVRIHGSDSTTTNHQGESLVFDLGTATAPANFFIAGSNFDAAATGGTQRIRLQGGTADSWTSPQEYSPTASFTDRANKKSWAFWTGIAQSYRFWRIQILNNDNLDGFIQIGSVFAGSMYQLSVNYQLKTGSQRRRIISDKQLSDSDATYGDIKSNDFEMSMALQKISQADKNFLDSLINAVGDIGSFPVLLGGNGQVPPFVWANFVAIPEFIEFAPAQGGSTWQCRDMTIRESA